MQATAADRRRGHHLTEVGNLPDLAPPFVCGLSVVSESVVCASGTNDLSLPVRVMGTIDGGATWQADDMSEHQRY